MHDQGPNVPELRFSGFEAEWQTRELGEITTKIGSGKTPKGGRSVYLSNGIPLLRSQNIVNDTVDRDGLVFISDEIDEEMSNSRVQPKDVLLNITGASIGRSAVYRSSGPANVNQHVCIIRSDEDHESDFIQLHLTAPWGQKAIDSSQAGGGREGLNFQQIGKMSFEFPSVLEQAQIGSYFKSLDRMIGLHQRKHDKLVTLKQAMLQKMFPQDGATTPEIRFKGFEGEWETKRVDEIAPLQRGFDLPTTKVRRGEYPVVYSNGILRSHNEYQCEAPGVVTGRSGTIGKVTFVTEDYWPHNTSLWVTDFFDNLSLIHI